MAKTGEETSPGRRFNLIVSGLSVGIIIGGGLLVLIFFVALGFSNWIRSQPEPAVFLIGPSMSPSLQSFDVVYYRPPDSLRRGSIISYTYGTSSISHRIVGMPGETVAVREGDVLIGGSKLNEAYVRYPYQWNMEPVRLGAEEYLTIGDNRADASGRAPHVVPRRDIVGEVYRVIFPPWRARLLD